MAQCIHTDKGRSGTVLHKVKSGFCAGLCCGLVIFASIPHTAFALPLTEQTKGIGEVQNEISYFSNARMEEVPPSLLEEGNPSVDPERSPRAGEVIYRISTGNDWDELLRSNSDPTSWFGGNGYYRGTENVRIVLDNDMVVNQNSIYLIEENVTFTLDLNGHSLMVPGGKLSVKSAKADGTERIANTFILRNGTMDATGIDTANAMERIDIQQVDFVNMNGNAVSCDRTSEGSVSDCTFTHAAGSNNHTAIHIPNSGAIRISKVEIRDFGNGINGAYISSAGVELSDITISGANIGLELSYSRVKAVNVALSGNKASGSRGVNCMGFMGATSNLGDFLNGNKSDLSHVTISDFDSGILMQGSGTISLDNCEITNVNHGLNAKSAVGAGTPAYFNVRDSILKANASITAGGYSGDSYGIYAYGNGFSCVNTEVTGFKVGACSHSGNSIVANCTFDNLDYNINSYFIDIYNSVLKNAKYGIMNDGATSVIVDTEVIGKNTPGSIGIQESGNGMKLFSSDSYPSGSALDSVISCVESAYPDAPHNDMIVSGYDIGLQCDSSTQMEIAGIEVKNCGTGLKGYRFTGLRKDNVLDNDIHDCDYGIDCENLNLVNTDMHVYNCKETGVQIHEQLTGPRLLEIYNCKDGLITDGTLVVSVHLQIHDNTGNGLAYAGSSTSATINCSMEIYDNGGWNICGDDVPMLHVGVYTNNEFTCRLENGGLGNMNINQQNSSGSRYMLTATHLKSDGGVYYVYPGKEVCIFPQTDPAWTDATDWLEGCMVFDTENYINGAVAAYAKEDNIRTVSDQRDDTWNFVRTHFFAAKEGWVIQYDKNAPANMSTYPLVFAEGCNVTYDYETNGGTGMSETYSKVAYLNGDAVDLSLTASRPGYEFVGWNTDPDAHEALSALTVQRKDITLYAIYRKAVTFTYHTYDPALDYSQAGYVFNKETVPYADQAGSQAVNVLSYADRVPDSLYIYAGYSYDGMDTTTLFRDGVISSAEKTDIYCVYTMNGELQYLGPDGTPNDRQEIAGFYAILNTLPYRFSYVLKSFQSEKGYVFVGWRAADGRIYAPGSIYDTTQTSAELQAEVNPIMVSALTVSPKQSTIGIGDTLQMAVSIQPEDALNPTVTWTTSDASIATIDGNGLVTAHAEGTVTITASANDDSGCSDTASVVVVKEQNATTSANDGSGSSDTASAEASATPKTGDTAPVLPALLLGCLTLLAAGYGCLGIKKRYGQK